MNLGERVKLLRKQKLHMTQEEFAKSFGLSRGNIANIESGRISLTDRNFQDICEKYGVNEEWLRTGVGGNEDENIFVQPSPFAKAYNRFGYLIENGSPQKKAVLTALLELMYVIPDDQWEFIMSTYQDALQEAKKEAGKG